MKAKSTQIDWLANASRQASSTKFRVAYRLLTKGFSASLHAGVSAFCTRDIAFASSAISGDE